MQQLFRTFFTALVFALSMTMPAAQQDDMVRKWITLSSQQVIHEKWGENFNSFLNSYRIKEACRRLGDVDHYGQLTIEAIATGVGFRSRTSFVTSFKRITGLTPSEYQRLAREEASAALLE